MSNDKQKYVLRFGIYRQNPYWTSFLKSEGFFFEYLSKDSIYADSGLPCFPLVVDDVADVESSIMANYLNEGGLIFASKAVFKELPATDIGSWTHDSVDTRWERTHPGSLHGGVEIRYKRYGMGLAAELPFSVETLFEYSGVQFKYWLIDNDFFKFKFRRISKKNKRNVLVWCILRAFDELSTPLPFLWYYPQSYENLFHFRMDCDGYSLSDLEFCFERYLPHAAYMSWFINCCSYNNHQGKSVIAKYSKLGHDIQSHGYVHCCFPDEYHNRRNIELAESSLLNCGIHCHGFVAPVMYFYWHCIKTLVRKGYRYAAFYGFDADRLPYRHVVSGKIQNIFELPFFPFCLGDFLKLGIYDIDHRIKNYYDRIIDKKLEVHDPLLFYGHPEKRIGKYPQHLDFILARIEGVSSLWTASLTELCDWWKERERYNLEISFIPMERSLAFPMEFLNHTTRASVAIRVGPKARNMGLQLPKPNHIVRQMNYEELNDLFDFSAEGFPLINDEVPRSWKNQYLRYRSLIGNYLRLYHIPLGRKPM